MEKLLKFTWRQTSIENTSACIKYLRGYSTKATPEKYPFLKYGNFEDFLWLCYAIELKSFDLIIFTFHFLSDRNPTSSFLYKENRELMKSITRVEFNKLFAKRPTAKPKTSYNFLTTAEVKSKFEAALRYVNHLLQMPPIVPILGDNIIEISDDPALQGLWDSKFIFVDIGYSVKDKERTITVRQADGKLESATMDVRRRMNQIYNPMRGRKLIIPQMFEGWHLNRCLDAGRYEFILDRACIQFEPYDVDFHRVTSITYQHINDNNNFDSLRSTRHFGPMAFFLAWHKMIDNLLLDMLKRDLARNGAELICLMYNLKRVPYNRNVLYALSECPEKNDEYYYKKFVLSEGNMDEEKAILDNIEKTVGKTADDLKVEDTCLAFIEIYANTNATKKNELNAAIGAYRANVLEKERLLEGLHKAHGVS